MISPKDYFHSDGVHFIKTSLLVFILVYQSAQQLRAQSEFWGMTRGGGTHYLGTIFKTKSDGTGQTVKYSFTTNLSGANSSYTHLVETSTGNFYGVTTNGGVQNKGVLFEYNLAQNKYTVIKEFGAMDSSFPKGSLVKAPNGKLYGMALGGFVDGGIIFEVDPTNNSFSTKFQFGVTQSWDQGAYPEGSLVLANGKLYGLAEGAGAHGLGVLFEYNFGTNTYTKKIDFDGQNGAKPEGNDLFLASNGKLYGLTQKGGANDKGTLFEYDPAQNTLTKKWDFDGAATGTYPQGNVVEAPNGSLYGVTFQGGTSDNGVLFEFDPSYNLLNKKIDFSGNNATPISALTLAPNGNFYGVASGQSGGIFEYDYTTNNLTTKKSLFGSEGYSPRGSLLLSSNGKLYGMTGYGGASNDGVIFEYDYLQGSYSKKMDFDYAPDGARPTGNLILHSNGKFYGTTAYGGTYGGGVIFEYDSAAKVYTKKFDFDGTNGAGAFGGLTLYTDGSLYGMTLTGGLFDQGVIFRYDPITNSFTKLIEFGGAELARPWGGLCTASNGKLYGMTEDGPVNHQGGFFEYDPSSNSLTKKIEFDGFNSGSNPHGNLIQASNGKLYGLTSYGGINGNGVLFEYDLLSNTLTKKFDFDTDSGTAPFGSLTQASNGKLYGMTSLGGAKSEGTLFEFDIVNNQFTKRADFDHQYTGQNPDGNLTESPDGNLYGMTLTSIFRYSPSDNSLIKLLDFNGDNGAFPILSSSLVLVGSGQGISFGALATKTFGDAPFVVNASSTLTSPITFASDDPSIASLSGSTITILKAGTVNITAHQVGTTDVTRQLTINKADQAITFNVLTAKKFGDAPFDLSATSPSNLPVTFTSDDPTIASVSGSTVTIHKAGIVNIIAHQSGSANFNPASDVTRQLNVNKADQTITFSALPSKTFGDAPFDLSASAQSGLSVTFTCDDPTIASISGSTVTIHKAGIVNVTAHQSGSANFNQALDVTQQLNVKKAEQTITFSALPSKTFGDAPFDLTANTPSGLSVTFTSDDPTIASVSGSTVTIHKAGIVNIIAHQSGSANFNQAPDVTRQLTIFKAGQTITLSSISTKIMGDAPFHLSALATSGLDVTLTSLTNKVSISGDIATLLKAGRETVVASQAGNSSYNSANSVSVSFCIDPPKPTISQTPSGSTTTLSSSAGIGNRWYLNGNILQDSTRQTLFVSSSGTYQVLVAIDDCQSTLSDNSIVVITGIEPNPEIAFYPNPTGDFLIIEGVTPRSNECVIVDAMGRESTIAINSDGNEISVDVRSFSAGLYTLRIPTTGNIVKFIKK